MQIDQTNPLANLLAGTPEASSAGQEQELLKAKGQSTDFQKIMASEQGEVSKEEVMSLVEKELGKIDQKTKDTLIKVLDKGEMDLAQVKEAVAEVKMGLEKEQQLQTSQKKPTNLTQEHKLSANLLAQTNKAQIQNQSTNDVLKSDNVFAADKLAQHNSPVDSKALEMPWQNKQALNEAPTQLKHAKVQLGNEHASLNQNLAEQKESLKTKLAASRMQTYAQAQGKTSNSLLDSKKINVSMPEKLKATQVTPRKSFFPNAKENKIEALKSEKIATASSGSEAAANTPKMMSLEEVMLGQAVTAKEAVINEAPKAPTQVIDMSNIKMTDTKTLINEISNYIQQNNIQNQEQLDLVVRHESLGEFKVNVQQLKGHENIKLEIMTTTAQGNEFFVKNESELIKSLDNAGIKLADMKVVAGSKESFSMSSDSSSKNFESGGDWTGHDGNHKNFSRQDESAQKDAKRRQALWEQYKERMGA